MISPRIKQQAKDFDPSVFGFDTSYTERARNTISSIDRDYLIFSRYGDKNKLKMNLILSKSTAALALELFGERVDFAPNQKGQIIVYQGNGGRKMSRHHSSGASTRITISMDSLAKDYIEAHGEFRHLYMEPDIYANGLALIFTPGERDEE